METQNNVKHLQRLIRIKEDIKNEKEYFYLSLFLSDKSS